MKLRNIGTKLTTLEYANKVSPIDGRLLYELPLSRDSEIVDIFQNAQSASRQLSELGVFGRTLLLEKAIDKLIENRSKIVELVIQETGKSKKLSEGEFDTAILFGQSLLGLARFQDGITIPSANARKFVYEKRVPFGVAGLIVSYNTPMPNYAWKVFPSLISGNVSILKPSPHTSGSAQIFVESFENIGFPEFSINLIHGDHESGKILCDQELDLLSFTGSYNAGIQIQSNTSSKMRKNIFELGGNNCLVVSDKAQIDKAVEAIMNSAFSNAGQRCAAGSRVLLHSKIADTVLNSIKMKLKTIKVGVDADADLGPIIDLAGVARYETFLTECNSNNLSITKAKPTLNSNEFYLEPALVEGFKESNPLFATEIFAPILRSAIYTSNEEAIRLANNSKYALTAAIWSDNLEEVEFFTNNLKAGVINVNGPTHGSEFQFPFGGIGHSGNGSKEVGLQCLDQYSHHKLVTVTNHG